MTDERLIPSGLCAANQKARVGSGALREHECGVFEAGNVLLLTSALGPPRLWGFLLDAASAGFSEGIQRSHDGRASTRLLQGFDSAQKLVRGRVASLVERQRSDVGLLAMALSGSILHVVSVGPARAYVHRRKSARRLTPESASSEGLSRAQAAWCAEQLEPGDLVVAGSASSFVASSMQLVAQQIERGQALSPSRLLEDLNGPAAAAGLGAAALCFVAAKF